MKFKRWIALYVVEIAWLFYMAGLLLALLPYIQQPFEEMGDIALISRQVHLASEWDVLRGAYSRLGFFHIGPISFYWMALIDFILPSSLFAENSHYYQYAISIWLANTFIGLISLRSARRLGLSIGSRLMLLVFTIVFLWHLGGHVLFSPWGPHLTILPILWLCLNLIRAGQADFTALPGLALSSIWILHSHAGSLTFLGPSLVFLFYLWYRLYRNGELIISRLTWPLTLGLLIVFTGISIPVYEAFINDGGNLKAIFEYLDKNSTWRKPGKALVFMLSAMDGPFRNGIPIIAPVAALLYAIWGRKKLEVTEKRILALCLILTFGSFYGALRTPGVLVPHLFDHLLPVNALLLAINLRPLFMALARYPLKNWFANSNPKFPSRGLLQSGQPREDSSPPEQIHPGRFDYLILTFPIALLLLGISRDSHPPESRFQPSAILNSLLHRVDLKDASRAIYRIGLSQENLVHWPGAAGLILQMERRGYRACIDPPFDILFGPETLCPARVNGTILIEPAPENPKMKHGNAFIYHNIQVEFRPENRENAEIE